MTHKKDKQSRDNQEAIQAEHDSLRGRFDIVVPIWLSRIWFAQNIHTGDEYTLDSDCKLIYAYFLGYGKAHGYKSIYPNQTTIQSDIGMVNSTLRRKIKVLEACGLIKTYKQQIGVKTSNRYEVKQPTYINDQRWYGADKEILGGKEYTPKFLNKA